MSSRYLKLREFCEVFDGPHATPTKTDEGPYYLSISSLENGKLDLSKSAHIAEQEYTKWTKRVTPRKGDLLFSYETRLGEAALMPDGVKACLGRRMGILRPDPQKVLPSYLLYSYLAPEFQGVIISNTITGATVHRLSLTDLPDFQMRIPPIEVQQRTVAILSALDARIELNQRLNEELEGMAKLLYDYWFVQHDFPMSAAQAAALGKPKLQGYPYRTSGGRMVWSHELNREVPEDWRVGSLGELCDIFDGPHATPTKTESGPYYLSISSLENGRLDLTKSARLSEAEFVKWTRRVTPTAGDVLFSYETRLGEAALMPAETQACLGRRMGLLRPKRNQVSPAFLLYSYLSQAFQGVIRANVIQGATVERISLNDLPSFPMLIPALEQRDAASKILTPLQARIAQNQRETQELTALRDWLLPMLMNGQVTVG